MWDIGFLVLGVVLLVCGWAFCFIPALSGPPLAFLALVALRGVPPHATPGILTLVAAALLTIAAVALDYVAPLLGARSCKCSKAGMIGCVAGTVAGLFFMPFGVLIGPFLGAWAGELFAGKSLGASLKAAFGALVGYLAGLAGKLACCFVLTVLFVWALLFP